MIQKAKIVAVDGDNITCTIECGDACVGCGAKALCGKGESKIIELVNTGPARYVGDIIEIEVDTKSGFKAIGIAYLVPVVIIIAILMITQFMGISELWQGVIALVGVAVHYIIIKIFGLGQSISITIIDNE